MISELSSIDCPILKTLGKKEYKVKSNVEIQLIKLIDCKIKPLIAKDGGNIVLKKYKNNIVYFKLFGSCQECSNIKETIKNSILSILQFYINEIKSVKLI